MESNYNNPQQQYKPENKKVVAGVLALLLGGFGIHKFILGYTTEGVIILLLNLVIIPVIGFVTCGLGFFLCLVTYPIPFIEGIIYLTKSDENFFKLIRLADDLGFKKKLYL